MSARQVVLDTETTGLEAREGHRIIEVGCIEIVGRRVTERRLHHYINPQRASDEGALAVHGDDVGRRQARRPGGRVDGGAGPGGGLQRLGQGSGLKGRSGVGRGHGDGVRKCKKSNRHSVTDSAARPCHRSKHATCKQNRCKVMQKKHSIPIIRPWTKV